MILLDAHVKALRAHVRAASEDTDNRHGWARGHTPMDDSWEWHHLRELRDAGLIHWRDEWKDILVKPTDAGWEVLSTLPFEAQP